MSTEKKKKLTLKQTQFIKHYFEQNGNGTQAARLAGYKGNDKTLQVVAVENLSKPIIQEAITKAKEKLGLTAERLLARHSALLDYKDNPSIQFNALKLAYEINGKLVKTVEIVELTKKEIDDRVKRTRKALAI